MKDHPPNGPRINQKWSYVIKLCVMASFFLCDIILNSYSEYEDFSNLKQTTVHQHLHSSYSSNPTENRVKNIQVLLLGFQILCQISAFFALFLLFADTIPFQMGLMSVLMQRFSTVMWLHPLYFGITCLLGGIRIVRICSVLVCAACADRH